MLCIDYLATESFPAFTTSLFADERSHLDSYISTPHIDEVLSKLAGSRTGSCENPSGSESLSNRSIPVPAKKCVSCYPVTNQHTPYFCGMKV